MTQDEQDYQDYLEFQKYQQSQMQAAPQGPAQEAPAPKKGMIRGTFEEARGLLDTASSFASGAVAEPVAGVAGLGTLLATGNSDKSAAAVEWVRGALTKGAWTDKGKRNEEIIGKVAEKVAPALQHLDDAIYWIAGDNAAASAALKTAVYGAPAVLGLKGKGLVKAGTDASIAGNLTKQALKNELKRGEELGIKYNNDDIKITSRAAADRMAPNQEKAANMDTVQDAVIAAEKAARAERDAAFVGASPWRRSQTAPPPPGLRPEGGL